MFIIEANAVLFYFEKKFWFLILNTNLLSEMKKYPDFELMRILIFLCRFM